MLGLVCARCGFCVCLLLVSLARSLPVLPGVPWLRSCFAHAQEGKKPSRVRTLKADIYINTSHLLPDLAVYGSWLSTAVNPKRRSVASGDGTVGRNVANIRRLCSWLIAGERARIPRLNALGKLGPDAIVGRWLQYADEHLTAGAHIKQQTVSKHLDALALYYRYYCAISLKRHTAGTELREALEQKN